MPAIRSRSASQHGRRSGATWLEAETGEGTAVLCKPSGAIPAKATIYRRIDRAQRKVTGLPLPGLVRVINLFAAGAIALPQRNENERTRSKMSMKTRTWSPRTHADYDELKGMDVYTSDDEKIGEIDEVLHPANDSTQPEEHFLHVKPGMLGKISGEDEMYLRADEVKFIGDDRVVLGLPKNRVESGSWAAPRNVDKFRRR
jgi:hypothetical protein